MGDEFKITVFRGVKPWGLSCLIAYEWEPILRMYVDICLPDYTALLPRSVIDVFKDDSMFVTINILKLVQQRRKIQKPENAIYPISTV